MKLKAATLIESLVAMTILISCLGIASMIFSGIVNSDTQVQKLKAKSLLDREYIRIIESKQFIDGEIQIGDWTLKTTFEPYTGVSDFVVFSLTLMDQKGKIIDNKKSFLEKLP